MRLLSRTSALLLAALALTACGGGGGDDVRAEAKPTTTTRPPRPRAHHDHAPTTTKPPGPLPVTMTLTKCEADATNRTWSATYAVADGATFYTGERVVPLGAADNTLRFETDTYYFYAVMHQVGDGTCHTAVGLWMWK